MSDSRKQIDLIIKAALEGGKTLDNVVKSIESIEKALDDQVKAAKRGEGSIDDLKAALKELQAAQDQLKTHASLIDQFQRLSKQIGESETRAKSAATAFTEFKSKVDMLGVTTEAQASKLSRLGAATERAQATLLRQKSEYAELANSLKTAGIATDKLSEAETRALRSASQLGATMVKVRDAIDEHGKAVSNNAKYQDLFSNSGRTTLSLFQRFRGEILSVTASWVGLYGAINNVKSVLDAYNQYQGLVNQLSVGTGGDRGKAKDEFKYVADQAERLGINLEEAAKGYAKFSLAATFAGRSQQENKFLFESVAEVSRVAGLTSEQLSRVFYAISQIDSKGKVMAEEFNQQLGDALPGLTGVAKKATEGVFKDFNAAMKDGKVSLNVFVDIMAKYRDLVSGQLPNAITTLQAKQERMNNEIFKFKLMIAEGGFADAYADIIQRLTAFFKSKEGPEFAKKLSDALTSLANSFLWLVNNAETVKHVFELAFGLMMLKSVLGLGAGFVGLMEKITAVNGLLAGTMTVAKGLMVAFNLLAAFFVGWEIGKILREQFTEVRVAGVYMVTGLAMIWSSIVNGTKAVWEGVPAIVQDGLAVIGNKLTEGIRDILGIVSTAARALGKNAFADALDKAISDVTFKTGRFAQVSRDTKARLTADLAAIIQIQKDMVAYEREPKGAASPQSPGTAIASTPKPAPGKTGNTDADEKAAAKRLRIKEQLENQLMAITAKIDKQEKDDLDSRLRAIDETYNALSKKIAKFGGLEGKAMQSQLDQSVATLRLQETKKFNDALLKEQMELQRKLEQVDAQSNRSNKTDLDARLLAIKMSYEQTYREIEDYRVKLQSKVT